MQFYTKSIRKQPVVETQQLQVNHTYIDLDNDSVTSTVLNFLLGNKEEKKTQPKPEFTNTFVKIGFKNYPIITGTRIDLRDLSEKENQYVEIDGEVYIIKEGFFGNKYLSKI